MLSYRCPINRPIGSLMDLLVSFRVPLIVSYKEIPFYRKTP
nr:MAG TPA: hypothetical protein [Caudoviricetes sp.]